MTSKICLRISLIMDSNGDSCSHERRRLDILSLIQEVDQEKSQLQCEIDEINDQLQEITDVFDHCVDIPPFVLDTLQSKEMDLTEDVENLENMMCKLESKSEEYMDEYNDEKEEATEDDCSCVDNFKLL